MDKNKELEQKLKEFMDNFQLNTPELNNLEPKKKVYIDKIFKLFVQNICNSNCKNNEYMYVVKPYKLDQFQYFVELMLSDENINTLKDVLLFLDKNLKDKSVEIVQKRKKEYYLLHIIKYITNKKKIYVNGNYIIKIKLTDTLIPSKHSTLDKIFNVMLKIKNDKRQKSLEEENKRFKGFIHNYNETHHWWDTSDYGTYTDLDGSIVTGYSPSFGKPFTPLRLKSDQSLFFESYYDFQNIIQEIRKYL